MLVFEVIGGLILFMLLSLFSFILLPTIFGCFGFLLFIGVFLWLLVIFSANIVWFIAVVLISYLLIGLMRLYRYYRLPDYNAYLANNITAYTNGNINCCYCGSTQLNHVGLFGFTSKWRYFVCLSCHKQLYRFKVIG